MDLKKFMHKYYRPAHGPLVLSICVFGIATQALNIAVLTRRAMRTMPSNILLAGLSLAQLILLTNYIIGTSYALSDSRCNIRTKSYAWLAYLLFNVNVNVVFHTIALVHTTLLAVFRYAAVAFPIRCRRLVSDRGAKLAVISAFCIVPLACSTFYANSAIVERSKNSSAGCLRSSSSPLYFLKYTENRVLRDYNFIFFGTVCKLLPCAVMILLSGLLVLELKRVQDKRQKLKGVCSGEQKRKRVVSNYSMTKNNSSGSVTSTIEHNNHHHHQTTVMLVTVVLLLVCVEFPQGVMNLLFVTLDSYEFSVRIYAPLGDFFEMLTVLYSSVNFIIYCVMSSQFRKMFKQLFCMQILRDPVSVDESLLSRRTTAVADNDQRSHTDCSSLLVNSGHRVSLLSPEEWKKKVGLNEETVTDSPN